ncbi:MAG TPA: hypothetical protein VIG30_07925 [Ktedonobacterales bacterium]|jgi:RNA-binding protein 39
MALDEYTHEHEHDSEKEREREQERERDKERERERERERIRAELDHLRIRRRKFVDEAFEDLRFDGETGGFFRRRHRMVLEQLRHDLEMIIDLREHLSRLRYRAEELAERLEELDDDN